MDVELTADQRAFVRRAIESGRFAREEEAVQEAMALWEDRERSGSQREVRVDGEGREITEESMKELAEDIKQRLRRRIAAERSATSG